MHLGTFRKRCRTKAMSQHTQDIKEIKQFFQDYDPLTQAKSNCFKEPLSKEIKGHSISRIQNIAKM